jgi:uncharacterized protein (DUF736 family)
MRLLLAVPVSLLLLGLPVQASAAPQGEPVDGGPAPTQATAIKAGTAYSDDIKPGEARWFSVDAATGQQLGATLTEYGETEYGCCLSLKLADPDFNQIAYDNSYNSDGTAHTMRAETDEDGVDDDGTYYLSVELSDKDARRPVAFDFSVDVNGEGMLSTSASPTSEASASGDASASPSAQADSQTDSKASVSDSSTGNTLLWAVVGALALLLVLLLAMVAVLLRRLKR